MLEQSSCARCSVVTSLFICSRPQLQRVLRRESLSRKLDEIREGLLRKDSLDGMALQKVVGEDHTVFVLEERYGGRQGLDAISGVWGPS